MSIKENETDVRKEKRMQRMQMSNSPPEPGRGIPAKTGTRAPRPPVGEEGTVDGEDGQERWAEGGALNRPKTALSRATKKLQR